MPTHNVIFLVHGMGDHSQTARSETADTKWMNTPKNKLSQMANHFTGVREEGIENLVSFVPITYAQVFYEKAKNTTAQIELLKRFVGGDIRSVEDWIELQTEDSKEKFFWSHVMDVLLYRFSTEVRAEVHSSFLDVFTKQVEDDLKKYNGKVEFNIMAHSLGTAVTNGALSKLARDPIAGREEYMAGKFDLIKNYFAIANVSRVLWDAPLNQFYNEIGLRPYSAGAGYTKNFINVRHVVDPFPAPYRFDPTTWSNSDYQEIKVSHMHDINVHDWGHYLENPRVSIPILQRVLGPEMIRKQEAKAIKSDWSSFPMKMSKENRKELSIAVRKIEQNYLNIFRTEGNLIGDVLKVILQSVDELFEARKAIQELFQ